MQALLDTLPLLASGFVTWAAHRLVRQLDQIAERLRLVELKVTAIEARQRRTRAADVEEPAHG